LYVGDGLSDATGAVQADVAVAIAPETLPAAVQAPIVVTTPSLAPIPVLVELAQACNARIRENFVIGALYNAVMLPLCALGLVPRVSAAGLPPLEPLLVSATAPRLLPPSGPRPAASPAREAPGRGASPAPPRTTGVTPAGPARRAGPVA